jgi:hypothetical protein
MLRPIFMAALFVSAGAFAGCSLSSANPRYCDDTTPCADPRWPLCDHTTNQCGEMPDGAVADDGGSLSDGPLPDDSTPFDGMGGDGGCGESMHGCVDGCFALADPTHCGESCLACGGETPDCDGTACVCSSTSCPIASPICGTAGACRLCASHTECAQHDPQRPVCATNGTCGPAVCGDNVVSATAGERCDYGDTDNYDGCDPSCRYTGTVTTIAGKAGGQGYCDGDGTSARLMRPAHVVANSSGFIFTDSTVDTVRRVSGFLKTVSTLAGTFGQVGSADGTGADARFSFPQGVAADASFAYVADSNNHLIRRIAISTGLTDTIAGAAGQSGTADGPGGDARFYSPFGLALEGTSLYVADRDNCAVRMIDLGASGFPVSTVAGTAGYCGAVDGDKTTARFGQLEAVTSAGGGVLYVADTSNQAIRRVASDGSVTTPYGTLGISGWADGTGSAARFSGPKGIAYANSTPAALIVADSANYTLRKVDLSSGLVSTLAGTHGQRGTTDGLGSAASFMLPQGVSAQQTSSGWKAYVADNQAGTLRMVDVSSGAVSSYVGAPSDSEVADGTGPSARFGAPAGLVQLGDALLIADNGGKALRQLSPTTGGVVTVAGSLGLSGSVDDVGPAARFQSPTALATRNGRVWVVDRYAIREFDPISRAVSTRAGSDTAGSNDGDGTAARFTSPMGLDVDDDYVYVADLCSIRRMTVGAPWSVTTILGDPLSCGAADGVGAYARLNGWLGLLLVGHHLYVVDFFNYALRRVDLSGAPVYRIDTVAGALGEAGNVDGVGTNARFTQPRTAAYDGLSLFVVDKEFVRQVDPLTMTVSTLLGKPGCSGAIDGDYSHAGLASLSLWGPGITYHDGTRLLYLSEGGERVVREIR